MRTRILPMALGIVWLAVPAASAQDAGDDARAIKRAKLLERGPTDEQARALEEKLKAEPDDLEAHSRLLEYYFLRARESEALRQTRQGHVLWVIRHHPEAPIAGRPEAQFPSPRDAEGYLEAKALWLEHVKAKPKDTRILGNAAHFLLLRDRETAERLLTDAQALEPDNPRWSERLGQLHQLGLGARADGAGKQAAAAKALQEFERALANAGDRSSVLEDAAKAALEAGQPDKARTYAVELLQTARPGTWNYGNAIHHGNLVLGRLALRSGDLEGSKRYLKKAGETPGSPQLNSFGPNMTLARELLQKDEKEAVLEYFGLCSRFWSMGDGRLNAWSATVKGGGIPDFGANLSY